MITIDGGTGVVTGGTLKSPGNVINVAQEFKTDTTYVDNTGPTVGGDLIFLDYAATSSSSKLLILANMYVSNQNQNRMFGYLYVGGSVSAAIGDAAGNRARVSLGGGYATDFDLLQQGSTDQSYELNSTCSNALGCTVNVTQGN